jgi:hypothetical protein
VALWSQAIGSNYGDWRQLPGFLMSPVIMPELFVMRHLLNDQPRWIVYLALLIFFASYLYAAILVRLLRVPNELNRP